MTSGVRLGTPAVTSRGMKEQEMDLIAEMIAMVIRDEKNVEQVKEGAEADRKISSVLKKTIKRICLRIGKQILFIISFCCITFKY